MECRYAIGVDLGGTAVKFSVVSDSGELLFTDKLPTLANEGRAERVIEQIVRGVELCVEYAQRKGLKIEGVGIGTPGIISEDGRVVLGGAENLPSWSGIALADIVEERTSLRCRLSNDANLMALGETRFGAAKGSSDVVFLTIGTGIGGGVLINGRLWGGYRNRGTEFGHISIKYDGEVCNCGNRGCLEHYASTSALVRRFEKLASERGEEHTRCDGEYIVSLYHRGDRTACETMSEHWDFLAAGIIGIIHSFAPQRVVIGGGISEAGEFYLEELRKRVFNNAIRECAEHCEIVGAELGNRAGSLGAAALIFD